MFFPYMVRGAARGFTLIELLVVIAIIGILASVALASLNDARLSAQYTKVQQELQLVSNALLLAGRPNQTLIEVTGFNCSDCYCRQPYRTGDLTIANLPATDQCVAEWQRVLNFISDDTGYIDRDSLLLDPWGSPYLLDQNEGEFGHIECTRDVLRSAGADGIYDDGPNGSLDDYFIYLPLRSAQCR